MPRHRKLTRTLALMFCVTSIAPGLHAQDAVPVDATPYFRFETRIPGVDPLPDGTMGDYMVEYFASAEGQINGLTVTPVLPEGLNTEAMQFGLIASSASCPLRCFGAVCIKFCGGTPTGTALEAPILVRVDPVPLPQGGVDFNVSVENLITNSSVSQPIEGFAIDNGEAIRKGIEN